MEPQALYLTSDRVLASLAHNITFVLFKMLFSPQFTRGRKCWRLYWIISGLLRSYWSMSWMAFSDWLVFRHVVQGGWWGMMARKWSPCQCASASRLLSPADPSKKNQEQKFQFGKRIMFSSRAFELFGTKNVTFWFHASGKCWLGTLICALLGSDCDSTLTLM